MLQPLKTSAHLCEEQQQMVNGAVTGLKSAIIVSWDFNSPELDTVKNNETNRPGVVKEEKSEESVVVDEGVQVVSGEVGPRHAPNYSMVNVILEKEEDGSGPRCGHTLMSVAAVGEEGSTSYMGSRLILFGGATDLEGNLAIAETLNSAGGARILSWDFNSPELDTVKNNETNRPGVVKEEKSEESVVVDEGVQVVSGEVGPRHAPNYSMVNVTLEKEEDGSGPRCGHTLMSVAAVGEEGSTSYMGPRLILFGGATDLEGNLAIAETPTSAGGARIRGKQCPKKLAACETS
nr:serine/threonine-protein phosphatase BSL3 [Tanacetum cinerariifolium]